MKKKILGVTLCLITAFNFVLPTMAGQNLSNKEIVNIDNYMQNVVKYTQNPFSKDNLLETNVLANTYNLKSVESDRVVLNNDVSTDELAIDSYDINDCKLVYSIKEDFFSELNKGRVSINKNDESWYLPAENGEGKNSILVFKERDNDLIVVSLSISQNVNKCGFLAESEIKDILEENKLECKELVYFNMPTFYGATVCAGITTTSGENYVMIVDKTMTEDFFEVGCLYSTHDLYDIFKNG